MKMSHRGTLDIGLQVVDVVAGVVFDGVAVGHHQCAIGQPHDANSWLTD